MALPQLNNATYELELPSSGEVVKFRPFLVKEQKILMMAQESEDAKQVETAFANIIKTCTFDKVDAYKLPLFDVEYIFLKLRSKSVGEEVEIMVPIPDTEEIVPVKVNLDKVDVLQNEDHTNEIALTDDIKLIMTYPTLKDMHRFDGKEETEATFDLIKSCIYEIHDGDEIHHKTDVSNKELGDFIDSMSADNLESIGVFFSTMPSLTHMIKVKNPKTKKNVEVELTGLQSFFG